MKKGWFKKNITVASVFSVVAFCLLAAFVALFLANPGLGRRLVVQAQQNLVTRQAGATTLAMQQMSVSTRPFGRWLGDILADEAGGFSVLRTAGAYDTITRIQQGKADFGVLQCISLSGEEGLSLLAPVDRHYLHVVTPADLSIESFRDLAGRRVGVGVEGGAHAAVAQALFQFYDFQDKPELISDFGADLEKAFLEGTIDAVILVAPLFDPSIERLLATGWYRLTPLSGAAALARYLPGVEADFLPPALYGPERSIPERAIPTLSLALLLVGRDQVSAIKVRALLSSIYGSGWPMPKAEAEWERLALGGRGFCVDPAAQAFFQQYAPASSDKLYTALSFLVGVAGFLLLTAWAHSWWRARKDLAYRTAMQPYFKRLLDVGNTEKDAESAEGLPSLLHDMLYTQGRAERAWIAGELDSAHMNNLYAVMALRMHSILPRLEQAVEPRFASAPQQADQRFESVEAAGSYAQAAEVEEERRYYQGMPVIEPEEVADEKVFGDVVTGPASVRVRKKAEPETEAQPLPAQVRRETPVAQKKKGKSKRTGRSPRRASQKKKASQSAENDDRPTAKLPQKPEHPDQMHLF